MSEIKLPHKHGEGEESRHLKEEVNKVDRFQAVAEVFKQLGDTTRLRIFWLLCHCEECVVNIAAFLELSSPAVSHHLRTLRTHGLIVSERIGKEVYYKAADSRQSKLLHETIEKVMEITCPEEE
ncbi:MAG TPA: metalloregulator ArsR/SmtB family transcription factor [Tetragenococcus sp.]|nr:metalloregulator ArsR/SmtB family transcription factor [Tetragenococcus sp.]